MMTRTIQSGHGIEAWCKHYTSINVLRPDKKCKAGLVYQDVVVRHEPPIPYRYEHDPPGARPYQRTWSVPCLASHRGDCPPCAKSEWPTQEEIDADERETAKLFEDTILARAVIVAEIGDKRGVAGELVCPVCELGRLYYSVAEYNGHIWGRCSTADCVRWME